MFTVSSSEIVLASYFFMFSFVLNVTFDGNSELTSGFELRDYS